MRCFASTPAAPLLFLYLLPRSWPRYFPPIPGLLAQTSSLGCGPGCGAQALALAPTLGCACALLRPWPVRLLRLKHLSQAQGFGHHLPSLSSSKLLALASQWLLLLALASGCPLLPAPTSRRSIHARQLASTSPQSSWTMRHNSHRRLHYTQPQVRSKMQGAMQRDFLGGDNRQARTGDWKSRPTHSPLGKER
jgi:hypothetical protein